MLRLYAKDENPSSWNGAMPKYDMRTVKGDDLGKRALKAELLDEPFSNEA